MCSDLKHLLAQLHIEKCILIGHSMGGKTAMTTALTQVSSCKMSPWIYHDARAPLTWPFSLYLLSWVILLRSSSHKKICLFHFVMINIFLCLCLQPSLVEKLVVVDISPAQTTTRTNFRYYIKAMQDVKISSDLPRSTARRMAEDQLRSLVKVSTPLWFHTYLHLSGIGVPSASWGT